MPHAGNGERVGIGMSCFRVTVGVVSMLGWRICTLYLFLEHHSSVLCSYSWLGGDRKPPVKTLPLPFQSGRLRAQSREQTDFENKGDIPIKLAFKARSLCFPS